MQLFFAAPNCFRQSLFWPRRIRSPVRKMQSSFSFVYLPFVFFRGFPALRQVGRSSLRSRSFRRNLRLLWNFGLPCPKLFSATFPCVVIIGLDPAMFLKETRLIISCAVMKQIAVSSTAMTLEPRRSVSYKFSSRILIPSSTLCPSISCIFWNLYFLCRLSKTLRWASFLCRRMKTACALLAAAPSLLGV